MLLKENDQWTSTNSAPSTNVIIDNQLVSEDEPQLQNVQSISIENYVPELNCTPVSSKNEIIVVCSHDLCESSSSLTTTLSISSTALSSPSSSINSATLKLFADFEVPWSLLPKDIIYKINNKQKLENRLSTFVNFVVEEIRRSSYFVPIRIFRNIAEKMVSTYPDTFEQLNKQNRVIPLYYETLITMMRYRNNYLNHTSKNRNDVKIQIKKRRMINSFKNNVTKWQPEIIDEASVAMTKKDKKKKLMDIYTNNRCIILRE